MPAIPAMPAMLLDVRAILAIHSYVAAMPRAVSSVLAMPGYPAA